VIRPPHSKQIVKSRFDAATTAQVLRSTFDLRWRILALKEQRRRDLIAGSIWGRYFEVLPLPKGGGDYDAVFCLRAIGIIKDDLSGGSRLVVRVTAAPIVTVGFPGFAVLATAAGILALTTLDAWSAVIFGFCLLFLAVGTIVCVVCNKWSAEEEILARWSSSLKDRLDSLPPRV
jgi:hypothetical protein